MPADSETGPIVPIRPNEPRYFDCFGRPYLLFWATVRVRCRNASFTGPKFNYQKVIIMAGSTKPRNAKTSSLDILPPELRFTRGHVLVRPESALQEAIAKRRGSRTLREVAKELGSSDQTLNALMSGRQVRRDAAVRVVVALGLTNKVTFLAADEEPSSSNAIEDVTAGKMSRALSPLAEMPPLELIAELHQEQPDRGWMELYKELWTIQERNRHREFLAGGMFRDAAEQLRLAAPREYEEVLHRLIDRFLPREPAV